MKTLMWKDIASMIFLAVLFLFLVFSTSYAADFTVSWSAPSTNADDTPLTDLDGYRIYYGVSPRTYIQPKGTGIDIPDPATTSYKVIDLTTNGTYYFAVTAYDTSGNESNYSNEVAGIYAQTIYIDNGGAGTSSIGTWSPSSGTGFYGANSLYAWGGAGRTYTWNFTPQKTGNYEVSMWWTYRASRNSSVPVDITYATGSSRRFVNQLDQSMAAKWNVLGVYQFNAGSMYKITVTATGTSSVSTCADAVRIAYMGVDVVAPGTPTATIYVTQ